MQASDEKGTTNAMKLEDWRFCSQEDDTISLHDCGMDLLKQTEDGLWLVFENGFNITKDNPFNPTGRHRLTGKAAVFLKAGTYLDGSWNRGCTIQGPEDAVPVPLQEVPIQQEQFMGLSPEVLDFTWEPGRNRFTIDAIDWEGYCNFVFACEEVWFCWNELPEDAWFQDWQKK